MKCCASFDELERQQQVLDVYRTRCLFVSGELVTFDQILLKREAERKAFTEMASLKQAETLEKIIGMWYIFIKNTIVPLQFLFHLLWIYKSQISKCEDYIFV